MINLKTEVRGRTLFVATKGDCPRCGRIKIYYAAAIKSWLCPVCYLPIKKFIFKPQQERQ